MLHRRVGPAGRTTPGSEAEQRATGVGKGGALDHAPTKTLSVRERKASVDLAVSVVAESYIGVYPLPVSGQVTIGRDPLAAFSVDHPSLSWRHATLDIGAELTIQDLASKNGTHVGARALTQGERRRLAIGDTVLLGAVRMVVLAWGARSKNPSFLGPIAFQSRLDYECARVRRVRQPFAVVRLRVLGSPGGDEMGALVASLFGAHHTTAAVGATELATIVAGAGEDDAAALADRLRATLASRGADIQHGIAVCPRDGRSSGALLSFAGHLLDGGEPSVAGSGRAVVLADEAMIALHLLAERVAATNVSVLLLGETGCGKEIFAETIHLASPRRNKPFVRLNCAELPESLLESELFGHERGAYSGAVQAKPGLLETADGGTVLLDEIGELPLGVQAKLLRFLEDGQIRRVGGLRPKQVDVRILAATNRDLEDESQQKRFRADLYHRVNGFSLTIPPLRERPADIAALAEQFLGQAATEQGRAEPPRLSPDALERLRQHAWPGNVRELRNVIRAALIISGHAAEITPVHLPWRASPSRPPATPPSAPPSPMEGRSLATVTSRAPYSDPDEARRTAEALERCGGNQSDAARLLGVSRTTLIKRLLAFGLRPPKSASPYADPDERQRVIDALAACGGKRADAAALLGVSRTTLIKRMLAFGLHDRSDMDE